MTESSPERDQTPPFLTGVYPSFIIGITGYMDLDPMAIPKVTERIEEIFQWVKDKQSAHAGLGKPLGLERESVIFLSALARGADQIAAELALKAGFDVRCPLPFPASYYERASTFETQEQRAQFRQLVQKVIAAKLKAGIFPECERHFNETNRGSSDSNNLAATLAELLLSPTQNPPDAIMAATVHEISERHIFHVLRPEDLSGDSNARLEQDLITKERRNLRYRSAGEYIAAYTDILIAATGQIPRDKVPDVNRELSHAAQSGSEWILRSRLRGLDPGYLPVQSALTWADNGPVFRIYCRRATVPAPADTPPQFGDLAIWHPIDAAVAASANHEHGCLECMDQVRNLALKLQALRASLSRKISNEKYDPAAQLTKHLPHKAPALYSHSTPLQRAWKFWADKLSKGKKNSPGKGEAQEPTRPSSLVGQPRLERLALLRRATADVNRDFDPRVKALTTFLFFFTFLIIVLLQVYENWVKDHGGHQDTISWLRVSLFVVPLGLFTTAWSFYGWHKNRDILDWQNDTRALAEGNRVQLYWSAAGTGLSVASNFLQRVRGEYAWIRSVISSSAFPYEADRQSFQRLSPPEKLDRLQRVRHGWLAEQLKFFTQKAHEFQQHKHALHFTANLLLIAGLALVLVNFFVHTLHLSHPIAALARRMGADLLATWLVIGAALWLFGQICTARAWEADEKARVPATNDEKSKKGSVWIKLNEAWHGISHHPLFLWGLGLSLGVAVASGIYGSTGAPACFPEPLRLSSIWKNLFFACGGLLHTWAAFKFYGENIKRYSALREVYRGAQSRMDDLLKQMEEQVNQDPPVPGFTTTLAAIHDLLASLGREHLNENSDWLQMHRLKPVEPILPAG